MSEQSDRTELFMRQFLAVEPRVYAYIRATILNRADAEEMLQDVATTAWRKFDQFEQGTNFSAWVMKIAYHQVLTFRRSAGRNPIALDQDVVDLLAVAEESSADETGLVREALVHCVDQLEPKDRRLIQLRYDAGNSNQRVAEIDGRSPSAVSRAIHRIRRQLLRCIQRVVAEEGRS